MTKTSTIQDYETLLKNHDWYYMMSEDNSVYNRGCHTNNNIKELGNSSEKHLELFNQSLPACETLIKELNAGNLPQLITPDYK